VAFKTIQYRSAFPTQNRHLDLLTPSIHCQSGGTIEQENSEIFMSENAKNKLQKLLGNLGCTLNCANFRSIYLANSHTSTVVVTFPDGRIIQGTGQGHRKSDADIAAAQDALALIDREHPDLLVDWIKLAIDAQAGDALIKLSVYLSAESKSAAENSIRLKDSEPNTHLAKVFDRWKAQNDPRLAIWGTNLSKDRKATLVEALLWQGYGQHVITANAPAQLADLFSTLLVPGS
jgi:hypothetical protein